MSSTIRIFTGLYVKLRSMSQKPIQLFVPKFRVEETLESIKEALENNWSGMGFLTNRFEEAWCDYTSSSNALFLNSATAALHLAVEVLSTSESWPDDSEVITSPLTFVSTNHAIMYSGFKPVFCDVDEFLCLDPDELLKKINNKTKAVMFVGFGGSTGQLERIVEICKTNNLRLIIDAAHMAGTRLNNFDVSHFGDVTCYSFQAVKNLPTADSGAIVFRDQKLAQEARKLSWLGINKDTFQRKNKGNYSWNYDVESVGYKYNGNSVIAAMGLVGLRYLDEDNNFRRSTFERYSALLESVSDHVQLIQSPKNCLNSQHLIQIVCSKRDELLEYLNLNEVYPGVHYRDNTEYSMYQYGNDKKSRASQMSDRIISLPNHLFLTDEDIRYICDLVINFFKK
jgi:dTDP-4-amino-4,6-dideoxygalactose transaminase